MARKSRRAKLQASLRTPMGSLLPPAEASMALSRSTENVSAPALVLDAVAGTGEVAERVEVRVEGVRYLVRGRPLGVGVDAG